MKILIVSPVPLFPTNMGNRVRILKIVEFLKQRGHDIHFLHTEMDPGDSAEMTDYLGAGKYFRIPFDTDTSVYSMVRKYVRKILDVPNIIHLPYKIDEFCSKSICDSVSKLCSTNSYDIVMVEYVFLSRVFGYIGNQSEKILDTHDLFADRHLKFVNQRIRYKWFFTTESEEAKGFKRADKVIAIQNNEAGKIRQLTGRNNVFLIGHMVDLEPLENIEKNDILFMSSSNIANIKALDSFVKNVFSVIRKRVPDARLIVAGSICEKINKEDGIELLGEVREVRDAYKKASVVINPMCRGTGLKIKSIEALGYFKPLVTTETGAEGLDSDNNRNFIVVRDDTEFAEAVIELLTNGEKRRAYSKNAGQYAEEYNITIRNELEKLFCSR